MDTWKHKLVISLTALAILLSLKTQNKALAQSSDAIFIQETGHWIQGPFLDFYQSADNPVLIFGFPITDNFIDPLTGNQTQYFQQARMDLIQTDMETYIQLAPLGSLLYVAEGAQPADIASGGPRCRYFPATDKSVCLAFLEFYEKNEGEIFFGDPIANTEVQEGRFVQYFRNAKMEWRPEKPAGERVVLSDLGRIYFDTTAVNVPIDKEAVTPSSVLGTMVKLQAHAFTSKALLPVNAHQSVSIIVQDQDLNPIEGATITIAVNYPDGTQEKFSPPVTNSDGISELTFTVLDTPIKEVVRIEAKINYNNTETSATTWFRIWW